MKQKICLLLTLCAFMSGISGAYAQADQESMLAVPDSAAISKNDYSDVPDEYLDEADEVFRFCRSDSKYSDYYNCECLSLEYLDQRIERGPDVNRSEIMLSLQKSCPDATNAAGAEYMECLGRAPLMPLNIPIEEFCTCFANTYAKMFERYKMGVNSKVIVKLQSRANLTCRDPALARRLYPERPIPAPSG